MPADALFLGVGCSGKSLLLRRLQAIAQEITLKGECRLDAIPTSTQPTVFSTQVGMEIAEFKVFKYSLSLREVGSALAGSWPKYFEDCSTLIYVSDCSNHATLAGDLVEFTNCWDEAKRLHKSMALVFNKMCGLGSDCPMSVPFGTLMDLFPIEDLLKEGVEVFQTSAFTGQNVINLLNWMIIHRHGGSDEEPQCCFPWRSRPSRVATFPS